MSQAGQFNNGVLPIGAVDTLTGNDLVIVPADINGNINVVGDVTTVLTSGDIPTNTLTITVQSSIKKTVYTVADSPGIWTKDTRSKWIKVWGVSGGSGGGSGRRGASTNAGGGGGGASGNFFIYDGDAEFFPANVAFVIGSGGAGGSAQTVNDTDGNNGTAGTGTSFGDMAVDPVATTYYGAGGINGTTAVATRGSMCCQENLLAINQFIQNATPAAGTLTDGNNATNLNSWWHGGSGGGGAGADAVTERTGGHGSNMVKLVLGPTPTFVLGGVGGVESGTINGADGADYTASTSSGMAKGGMGGGGGGGQSVGLVAGNGGQGGFPGGGGGGGGGSLNGTDSGAGGDGGDGILIIWEFF